ncbi:hypothetical protein DFJ74DRAFT_661549 [Hyaloraphidium curvatum]|nr:hypothetical protein DFJ74DRAFT_661549 [Hyaloraphidium curvatum]
MRPVIGGRTSNMAEPGPRPAPAAERDDSEAPSVVPPEILGLVAQRLDRGTLKEFSLASKTCLQLALPLLYLFVPPIDSREDLCSQKDYELLLDDPLDTGKLRFVSAVKLDASDSQPQGSLEPAFLRAVAPKLSLVRLMICSNPLGQSCLDEVARSASDHVIFQFAVVASEQEDASTSLVFWFPPGLSTLLSRFQTDVGEAAVLSLWSSLSKATNLSNWSLSWTAGCQIPELDKVPPSVVSRLRSLVLDVRDLRLLVSFETLELSHLGIDLGQATDADDMLLEAWPVLRAMKSLRTLEIGDARTSTRILMELPDYLEGVLLSRALPGLPSEDIEAVFNHLGHPSRRSKVFVKGADPMEWLTDEAEMELMMWTRLDAIEFEIDEDDDDHEGTDLENGSAVGDGAD